MDAETVPADRELEKSLLAALLVDPGQMQAVGFIQPNDFYYSTHRRVYERMLDLDRAGEPFDFVLMVPDDDDGTLAVLLTDLLGTGAFGVYAPHYARHVKDLSDKRKWGVVAQRLMEMSLNGKSPTDIAEYMEQVVTRAKLTTSLNPFDRFDQQLRTAEAYSDEPIAERRYVVADIIREASLSVFYGAPGDLKSMLCMDMCMCIAAGLPWLSPLPVEGNTQRSYDTIMGACCWFNYDQAEQDIHERLAALHRSYGSGRGVYAASHTDPHPVLETDAHARQLGQWLQRHGFVLVVVDSLLDVKGATDLKDADMGLLLRRWRLVVEESGASVILISHSTKETQDLYGSQFIKAKLDHLYHVSRDGEVVTVESEKQRSYGDTGKICARFTFDWFDGTRTLHQARFWGDATESQTHHPNNTTQAACEAWLMANPGQAFTPKEIAEGTGQDFESVRRAMRRLEKSVRNVARLDNPLRYHFGELGSYE